MGREVGADLYLFRTYETFQEGGGQACVRLRDRRHLLEKRRRIVLIWAFLRKPHRTLAFQDPGRRAQ
jgi:hypothetical protein